MPRPARLGADAGANVLRTLKSWRIPNSIPWFDPSKAKKQEEQESGDLPWFPKRLREIVVKDNIATINEYPDAPPIKTTCASWSLEDYVSPFEADVVTWLRELGGRVVAKSNLDEFGMGSHSLNSSFGPVKMEPPYGLVSAGGSSGGSAVAVASQLYNLALGTDTGGSVRLPAAYTGIVGFKPSYGFISRWGVIPYANSLDTVGILVPSVRDAQQTFQRVSWPDPKDPTSLTATSRARIKESVAIYRPQNERINTLGVPGDAEQRLKTMFDGLRIGVPLEYNIEELKPAIRSVWQAVLEVLQSHGATLVPISLPNTKHALSAYYIIAPAEAASNLSKYDGIRYGMRSRRADGGSHVLYSDTRGQGFGPEVRRRILLGSYTLSSEARDNYFLKAQKIRRMVQQDFDRVFALPNPLRPAEQFDLSNIDESVPMEDKLGPPQVDLIVCPTAPTLAPLLERVEKWSSVESFKNDVFTVPASLAGLPSISVPFTVPQKYRQARHPNSAGIQIIGQFGTDARVMALGRNLQELRLNDRFLWDPPYILPTMEKKDPERPLVRRSLSRKVESAPTSSWERNQPPDDLKDSFHDERPLNRRRLRGRGHFSHSETKVRDGEAAAAAWEEQHAPDESIDSSLDIWSRLDKPSEAQVMADAEAQKATKKDDDER